MFDQFRAIATKKANELPVTGATTLLNYAIELDVTGNLTAVPGTNIDTPITGPGTFTLNRNFPTVSTVSFTLPVGGIWEICYQGIFPGNAGAGVLRRCFITLSGGAAMVSQSGTVVNGAWHATASYTYPSLAAGTVVSMSAGQNSGANLNFSCKFAAYYLGL